MPLVYSAISRYERAFNAAAAPLKAIPVLPPLQLLCRARTTAASLIYRNYSALTCT